MNAKQIIEKVETDYIGVKKEIPLFNPGDTVNVHYKYTEAGKDRIQQFLGIVVQKRGKGLGSMFTVRKISHGVGVERIFPLFSPSVDKIELKKKGIVRRAKLFYLRNLQGKAARIKEKII